MLCEMCKNFDSKSQKIYFPNPSLLQSAVHSAPPKYEPI